MTNYSARPLFGIPDNFPERVALARDITGFLQTAFNAEATAQLGFSSADMIGLTYICDHVINLLTDRTPPEKGEA